MKAFCKSGDLLAEESDVEDVPFLLREGGKETLDELDGCFASANFLVIFGAGEEEVVSVSTGVLLHLFDL